MEPYIKGPGVVNYPPDVEFCEQCTLVVTPGDKVTDITWRLDYAPDWMKINPVTGLITGRVPLDNAGSGKFQVGADFSWQPGGAKLEQQRVTKPPKPAKQPKNDYATHYLAFINAPGHDWDAFDAMLSCVTVQTEAPPEMIYRHTVPSWRWPFIAGMLVCAALFMAAILIVSVVT